MASLFRRAQRHREPDIPPDLWEECPGCHQLLYGKDLESELWVCSKCMNSTHEVCLYHCREKKDYSAFVTKPKEQWEEVPRLPPNGEMMAWPASARLAAFRVVLDVLTELVDGK